MAYCSMIDYQFELPLLWAGMQQAKSISEPMVQQGNKKLNEKRIHPCHKPIMLYDTIFKTFGAESKLFDWGDLAGERFRVLDTHVGSGSIRISADKFGYDFTGCEIDKEYFDKEEKRWMDYKSNLRMEFPE